MNRWLAYAIALGLCGIAYAIRGNETASSLFTASAAISAGIGLLIREKK